MATVFQIRKKEGELRLCKDGVCISQVHCNALTALHLAFIDVPFEWSEPFFFFIFDDVVWALPDDGDALLVVLRHLKHRLKHNPCVFISEGHKLPLSWRTRWLGIPSSYPDLKPGAYATSQLPAFLKSEGPYKADHKVVRDYLL